LGATPFDLERFVDAQGTAYATALDELRAGRKRSHWIWFVFPQLRGLGRSEAAWTYGLSGLDEARAYLAHPLLGARLREAVAAMLAHRDARADAILGEVDAMKFRSCLTLFALAAPGEAVFAATLSAFFAGAPDASTMALLEASGGA
jgi:uncharacterized protein (DUF1810 family)